MDRTTCQKSRFRNQGGSSGRIVPKVYSFTTAMTACSSSNNEENAGKAMGHNDSQADSMCLKLSDEEHVLRCISAAYGRLVESGKMTQNEADCKIKVMEAVVETLNRVRG